MTIRTRRLLTGAVTLAALCSCDGGAGGGSGTATGPVPLTREQVTGALLTTQDLGPGYTLVNEPDESSGLGCLAFLDDISENKGAAAIDHAEFASGHDLGSADVQTLVESFEDTEELTTLFDNIRVALNGCENVNETVDDVGFDLAVTVDAERSTSDTDDQINVAATGTATSQGIALPIDLRASLVRLDNHLTGVAVSAFGPEDPGLVAPLTEVAADRLAAVAAGEEPPPARPVDLPAHTSRSADTLTESMASASAAKSRSFWSA